MKVVDRDTRRLRRHCLRLCHVAEWAAEHLPKVAKEARAMMYEGKLFEASEKLREAYQQMDKKLQ